MANMDKLAGLVNSFGSSVLSVGREVGLNITLNKAKVSPGIKVADICVVALIGMVGKEARGRVLIMLDPGAFEAIVKVMSGGMITPKVGDDVSMSVVGELSNMIGGRALISTTLTNVDVTPPQMISGESIKSIPGETPGMKSFTLPFILQPGGTLYLVLTFGNN